VQFELSGLGPAVNKLVATVQVATPTIPKCQPTIDHVAEGDPRREATLLYVATKVDLYQKHVR